MLLNAYELPTQHVIKTEICIIGSGPAGITLAREFIGDKTEVCLLESGDRSFDPQVQTLNEAEVVGMPFLAPSVTRHRQFGGNANLWAIKIGNGQFGVRYAPLDAIDFEQRDWLPYSGWPFPKAHLDPFYERAQTVCQIGPYAYDADTWATAHTPPLALDPHQIETSIFQFGPRAVFYDRYQQELTQAPNITVCVNGTAVELEAAATGQTVQRLRVACLDGKTFWIEAKAFVLATGGLGNAHLLLASNQQQSTGLGNAHDQVGRFFMDHPLVDCGMFFPKSPALFDQMALYDLRQVNQTAILGKLGLAPAVMRREQLLNAAIILFPRPRWRQFRAVVALKGLAETLRDRRVAPAQQLRQLIEAGLGVDYVLLAAYLAATQNQSFLHGFGRGGWSDLPNNHRRFQMFQIFLQTEQAPDPNNRIQLTSDRDRLGCPKFRLHWTWGDKNTHSVLRTQDLLVQAIAKADLGHLELNRKAGQPDLCTPAGVAHHMGTTRMHPDPKQGVVDEHCRVHTLSNLYIAGSSVFPTGGYANPTLTIVALALRLADQLKHALSMGKL